MRFTMPCHPLFLAALVMLAALGLLAWSRLRRGRLPRELIGRNAPSRGRAQPAPRGGRRTGLVTDAEWEAFCGVKAGMTGEKGEAAVAGELALLGVVALHDAVLADSRGLTQIDHLVLGPDAIIVLETKTYSGVIAGELHSNEWTQFLPRSATRIAFQNPVRQNHRHRSAVLEIVGDLAVPVRGYVVSAGKARFCDALVGIVVPIGAIGTIFAVGEVAGTDQQALRTAWDRLVLAARAGEMRRSEHLAGVRSRRGLVASSAAHD